LRKLRQEVKRQNYRYSLWDHHPNVRLLMTENMLMERVITLIKTQYGPVW